MPMPIDTYARWIQRRCHADPEHHRLRVVIARCEDIIDLYRAAAGLSPLSRHGMPRGRKPMDRSTVPLREKKRDELLDAVTHREQHQNQRVIGCRGCYIRDYVYFQRHPEKKPKQPWWKARDGSGRKGWIEGGETEEFRRIHGLIPPGDDMRRHYPAILKRNREAREARKGGKRGRPPKS